MHMDLLDSSISIRKCRNDCMLRKKREEKKNRTQFCMQQGVEYIMRGGLYEEDGRCNS